MRCATSWLMPWGVWAKRAEMSKRGSIWWWGLGFVLGEQRFEVLGLDAVEGFELIELSDGRCFLLGCG
jgi:hypothetical protein